MGVNATGTLGEGLQVERRRREDRGAVYKRRVVGYGKFFEFFTSKWCAMVHSGCVVFKIHVSHGL